jgi:FAD:protein FMN transferase
MSVSRRDLFRLRRAQAESAAAERPGYWLHLGRRAMACRFEVTLPSELVHRMDAARDALDTIDALEEQLTIFKETSELSLVNREAAAHPVTVEPRLHDLLCFCHQLWRESGGAFDITSTALSRSWGFLRRQGRLPTEDELAEARAQVGMQHVALDPAGKTVSFDRAGVMLNLGGVGKGYALDRVADQMRAGGVETALISGGASSLYAVGNGPDGGGYEVGIRDPFDHGRRWGSIRMGNAGLGVSGIGEQSFEVEGRRYGHIIDPRSGWPVEGRALVAVLAPSATLADALATTFFVGGIAVAEPYTRAHPDVSVVVIDMPLQGKYRPAVILGRRADWRLSVAS